MKKFCDWNISLKIRDKIRWAIKTLFADFLEEIIHANQYCISTAFMHREAFLPYKNKHCDSEIAVIACGPSLNDYIPIPGAINIGVNMAVKCEKLNLDYLFLQDIHERTAEEIALINNYRIGECKKFYGINGVDFNTRNLNVPSESDAIIANASRYRTDDLWMMRIENRYAFQYDISTQPLGDFGSVVFSAIQFALWTNPKRIYLVGCDCSNLGHFNNPVVNSELKPNTLRNGYLELKKFVETYYPKTEIVSVNPVGLKGLFKDLFQK